MFSNRLNPQPKLYTCLSQLRNKMLVQNSAANLISTCFDLRHSTNVRDLKHSKADLDLLNELFSVSLEP